MTAAELGAELAPAKVNLTLHLCGQRTDGYHLLESLVVFPQLGDTVSAEAGPGLSLSLSGPFADQLGADADNLVLRAAEAMAGRLAQRPGLALHLEKSLPVASGLGGGSSDAAAALRLVSRLTGTPVPAGLALWLGADVPVCLAGRPAWMTGIGERLAPAPRMPGVWAVLVNPMVTVATGWIFAALERREGPPGPAAPPGGFAGFQPLIGWLTRQRNDLQEAAIACCPVIGEVLEALSAAPLTRMSGSGASCFALWPDERSARADADRIRRARPEWWIAAAPIPACTLAPV